MTTPGETGSVSQEQAAADSAQRQAIMGLASALETETVVPPIFMKGIVVSIELPTLTVQLGGDTSGAVAGVRFIDSYSPVVGDTVFMVKNGPDIFVFGQVNSTSTGSANGWTAPPLQPNVTTNGNGNGPVEYRVIVDNGDYKLQLRGSVALSAGQTVLFVLPAGARPTYKRSFPVARNPVGSAVDQVDFQTDGTVRLVASNVGLASVSVNAGGNDTNSTQQPNVAASGDVAGGFTDTAAGTNHRHICALHSHGIFAHSHTINDHTHTTTNTNVSSPTWVSLNGIEMFL